MIALVYSGEVRDNGTPFYVRMALRALGIAHKWYSPAYPLPQTEHPLWLQVDDGRDDLPAIAPRPNAYWAIDTHLGFEARLTKARSFDRVYCAQKSGAERMRGEGVPAEWLPLACSPEHHPALWERPLATSPVFDIAFVGHLQAPADMLRVDFLDAVFRAFPRFRFEFGVFHQEMAAVYHRARIGLNHSVRGDLNMRFFELASIGVPQLCEEMEGLADLGFRAGEHYLAYAGADEAIAQLQAALKDGADLRAMAARAHAHVRAHHTYEHRVKVLLGGAHA